MPIITVPISDVKIRTLSPLNLEKDVEFYEVQLKEGGALRSAAHFEGTREFLTVQKGKVRVESADDSEELETRRFRQLPAPMFLTRLVNVSRGDALVFFSGYLSVSLSRELCGEAGCAGCAGKRRPKNLTGPG